MRSRETHGRRGLRVTSVLAVAALVLTACTGGDEEADGGSAEAAAEQLAAGLTAGDVVGVPVTTDSLDRPVAEEVAEVTDGLGEVLPEVTVGEVTESESEDGAETASATLAWSWPLGPDDEAWTYESTVELARVDDEWQVVWDRALLEPSLRAGSTLDLTPIAARRGEITGAGGLALVTNRPVVRVGLDKTGLPATQVGDAARAMARLTDVDSADYVAAARAAGDRAFVEAIVYRSDETPQRVLDGYEGVPGGTLVPDEVPLAPTREFAAPILGTVGEVTAEMIEEDPETYAVGDVAGLSGLQQRYDAQLQGSPGVVVDAIASDGRERELWRVEAQQGRALATTLDLDLQSAAERLLADVGPASALVAIRPGDGAVLAAANGPGTGGVNVATFGQYAPGSTFKSVTALALLRAGLTPTSTVPCGTTEVVDGRAFENYDDYPSGALGDITLRSAIANSCNTAMIAERDELGDGDLAAAAASLGLGVDHDLGFPAYFGQVPPPETETERGAELIGQGRVLASPMAMAAVAASVQAGRTVLPRLLDDAEGVEPATPGDDVAPVSRADAAALQGLLRAVVTEGSGRALADVPGAPVLAKTGTAEFERDGEVLTHAWMIGAQGDLAVAVFVEEGVSGSVTAGPILEAFLRSAQAP